MRHTLAGASPQRCSYTLVLQHAFSESLTAERWSLTGVNCRSGTLGRISYGLLSDIIDDAWKLVLLQRPIRIHTIVKANHSIHTSEVSRHRVPHHHNKQRHTRVGVATTACPMIIAEHQTLQATGFPPLLQGPTLDVKRQTLGVDDALLGNFPMQMQHPRPISPCTHHRKLEISGLGLEIIVGDPQTK